MGVVDVPFVSFLINLVRVNVALATIVVQNFRGSISAESVCDNSCTTTGASLEPVRCMEDGEYPTNLWANVDVAG